MPSENPPDDDDLGDTEASVDEDFDGDVDEDFDVDVDEEFDVDEDFDVDLGSDLDDDLDEELVVEDVAEDVVELVVELVVEEVVEDDDVPAPLDDDDDDDDIHPSDVEADLEEILRDRIAASDDDDDDEDEDAVGSTLKVASVAPPRADEWTCGQCFLIVSISQFGSRSDPQCPSGEDPCESMERVRSY